MDVDVSVPVQGVCQWSLQKYRRGASYGAARFSVFVSRDGGGPVVSTAELVHWGTRPFRTTPTCPPGGDILSLEQGARIEWQLAELRLQQRDSWLLSEHQKALCISPWIDVEKKQ